MCPDRSFRHHILPVELVHVSPVEPTIAEEQMETTKSTSDDLTATVSFRVTDRERRILEQQAMREERTVSNYLRQQLRRLLDAAA
jgi:hypothetical protein